MRVGDILRKAQHGLDEIDVELLLIKVLTVTRANLKAYPERDLTADEQQQFAVLLERRKKGEPIAYILGHKEFWSLDFLITPEVLIPRADTELLVELALEQIAAQQQVRLLDLGTGSGAIALAIASERPDITVIATDVALESLQVAQANAKHLHISNIEFMLGDWFAALSDTSNNLFDIIVSNPPYIAAIDPHLSQGDLRFEPRRALASGTDGMDALRLIISQAPRYLQPQGVLLVEHGYNQQQLVAQQFAQAGLVAVEGFKDLSGVPRVTKGRRSSM